MKEDYIIYKEDRIKHEQAMKEQYQKELNKLEKNYLRDQLKGVQVFKEHYEKNRDNWLSLIKTREDMIQEILNETDQESRDQWDWELYDSTIEL